LVPAFFLAEEILGKPETVWFSDDARRLLFATFNDSNVGLVTFKEFDADPGSVASHFTDGHPPFEMSVRYSKVKELNGVRVTRGPFLTSPLGANFDPPVEKLSPRCEFCPLGVNLSPGGKTLCSPLHSSKQLRVFTPGLNITPGGQISPLGPGMKLRMGLRSRSYDRELQRQRCKNLHRHE
jgi:hypothetical protein